MIPDIKLKEIESIGNDLLKERGEYSGSVDYISIKSVMAVINTLLHHLDAELGQPRLSYTTKEADDIEVSLLKLQEHLDNINSNWDKIKESFQ